MENHLDRSLDEGSLPAGEIFEFSVPSDRHLHRLDIVMGAETTFSRTRAKALVEAGRVSVNGRIADRPSMKVLAGARISVLIPPPTPSEVIPENLPIEIIYQDSSIAIVNKPPGMIVHPADGVYTGTLVNALTYHLKDLSGIGGKLRPGIVHRLDKETSGVIVIAKTDEAHRNLAQQFKHRSTRKEYLTLVQGEKKSTEFVISGGIVRHPVDRKRMTVVRMGGRKAKTRFLVEARWPGFTLIRAYPLTGRTHQIRVHLASVSLHVVGDLTYGYRNKGKLRTGLALLCDQRGGFFLHAHRITFQHPTTGDVVTYEAPIEPVFKETIDALDGALEREE